MLTVGTAGHVDHGKTWLVRALTGKDTDRLPEEQRRGISIELGYAPLDVGNGRVLSLVDVPGHERFVRTMVAGATGIDAFLLVVDAGEGPRAQTYEHLAILRLLGVSHGVAAVTKTDAVPPERLAEVVAEVSELVPGTPVIPASAVTGEGLDELRAALAALPPRAGSDAPARLPVDRSFSLTGIGTVVTGTLWSGSIGAGDLLAVEPAGLDVRVRSVEVHDTPVERADAGRRVAVALPGVERKEIRRGDVLTSRGAYPVSYRLDVELSELEPIADDARLQVHHGTTEVVARVVRLTGPFAQLRLARPVVAARGDRVVLRAGHTVGGARVLDPAPPRRLRSERFELLAAGDPAAIAEAAADAPLRREDLAARGLLFGEELGRGLESLERIGDWYVTPEWLDGERTRIDRRLRDHAASAALDPGVPTGELASGPWGPALLERLRVEQRGGKAYAPGAAPALGGREAEAEALKAGLARAGAAGLRVEDGELALFLERAGELVRLGDGVAVSATAYDEARRTALAQFAADGRIRLATFRDALGISRRPAQLLLERLDADGVTRRIGDERIVRRSAR